MDQKTIFHVSSELVLFGGLFYYMHNKNNVLKKEISNLQMEIDELRELVEEHVKPSTGEAADLTDITDKVHAQLQGQQKLNLQLQQFQQQIQMYQNQQQVQQQTMNSQINQLQQQLQQIRGRPVEAHPPVPHQVPRQESEETQKKWEEDQMRRKHQEEDERKKQEFLKAQQEQWMKTEHARQTQARLEQEAMASQMAQQQAAQLAQRQHEAHMNQLAQVQQLHHMMAQQGNVTVTAIPIFPMNQPPRSTATIEEETDEEEEQVEEVEVDEVEIDAEVAEELEKLERTLNQPSISKSKTKIVTPPRQKSKTRSKSGQKKKRGRKPANK
jgi:hypothetical protein